MYYSILRNYNTISSRRLSQDPPKIFHVIDLTNFSFILNPSGQCSLCILQVYTCTDKKKVKFSSDIRQLDFLFYQCALALKYKTYAINLRTNFVEHTCNILSNKLVKILGNKWSFKKQTRNRARILNFFGAQEPIPRKRFRQPMKPGRPYDNPNPIRFLAPMDCSKIPALWSFKNVLLSKEPFSLNDVILAYALRKISALRLQFATRNI